MKSEQIFIISGFYDTSLKFYLFQKHLSVEGQGKVISYNNMYFV